MRKLVTLAFLLAAGCAASAPKTTGITAEIWADNWFEMYVDGAKVLEDSVPITTERSFNAETTNFTSKPPMTVAFMVKDFKENDTGLEYIGTNRQQMGDGGFIAQFRDNATGKIIGATDSKVRCLVVQRAPTDRACAKERAPMAGKGPCGFVETPIPENWTATDFDDSDWPAAVEHSTREVSPKDGYDEISWDSAAKLIWSDDLVQDNTLLCRMTVAG
ncbi:PEBP family protein [Allopontixanthobacter sediminis]|uniref:PEBP family protein n=1 Tax=Allopontixanthobacter sediminis TaxID=1689985 RepID=A0A845B163_9SPHN|nr:PEBP family protein [Allopontixanthobacter sediminis]MXP43988.1 PEBP family protein [Allopontixanthobacter sediminis]